MLPIVCENDVIIEACLNTTCENISASIDDGVIKMMANLTRQRIYLIIILLTNNGMVVQKSHPMKISERAKAQQIKGLSVFRCVILINP